MKETEADSTSASVNDTELRWQCLQDAALTNLARLALRPGHRGRLLQAELEQRFAGDFDLLAARAFREVLAFFRFCFGLGFGVELARVVLGFEARMSESS